MENADIHLHSLVNKIEALKKKYENYPDLFMISLCAYTEGLCEAIQK